MLKLHKLLLCPALAMAGIVLAVPVTAQMLVAPERFAVESVTQPIPGAITEPQDQNAASGQKLRNGSSEKHPASAASSDNASNNTSVSSTETKDRKKNKKKDKAKPASSEQEEYSRFLLGIYG